MRSRLLLAGTALALAGCTVGPNYVEPQLPTPPAYASPQIAVPPGEAIDPAHWWSAFGDAGLDALVERAMRDNPDILTAASRVREARYGEIVAGAAGKPTLDAMAGVNNIEISKNAGLSQITSLFGGGGSGSTGGSSGNNGLALPGGGITTFSVGFDASWEIDLFGGDRRQRESARAQSAAAVWNRRDAAITLAAEVAQAYFALRLGQAQIAIVEDELTRQRRGLEIAGNQALVGLTPQIDVTRQRATISSTQARLEPLRSDVQVRIHALGILVGASPESLGAQLSAPAPALGPVPVVPAGLPSDLL
ncbi:TolC family protein, partial [Sphingomonas bacterium]|uniref:TolC family protein n=1 Tax=Sphingomonas bacterium TaxID=1895847 RepID=UPI001575BBC2